MADDTMLGGTLRPSAAAPPGDSTERPAASRDSGGQPALFPGLGPGSEPAPGYQLVERLGRGGFGEVWKAIAPGGFPVALKLVPL